MDELAGFGADAGEESDLPQHFLAVVGVVTSPYGARFDPSGSSNRSAISVTCNLAPLAIGTDTASSILAPARYNNVVGVRPTHNLISRTEIIPGNSSYDVAGPLSRNVLDAALMIYTMQGDNPQDDTQQQTGTLIEDPTDFLFHADTSSTLRGVRIALGPGSPLLSNSITQHLEEAGAEIVGDMDVPLCEDERFDYSLLDYDYGVKNSLNRFLADQQPCGVSSLAELVAFNDAHKPYGQYQLEYLVELKESTAKEAEKIQIAVDYFNT